MEGGGRGAGGGGEVIVYSVANYRSHYTHFWVNVTIFLTPNLPISYFLFIRIILPLHLENVRTHAGHTTENVNLFYSIQLWKCDAIQRHSSLTSF